MGYRSTDGFNTGCNQEDHNRFEVLRVRSIVRDT